jgi:hypothetical protein
MSSLGSVFEKYSPYGFLFSFLIFEAAVIIGTLAFSFFFPYEGLIGCSPGVYGYIGATLALLSICYDRIDSVVIFVMSGGMTIHLLGDILLYFLLHSSSIGYIAHFFGFFTGLFLTLFLLLSVLHEKRNKSWISFSIWLLSGICFLTIFIFFFYYYQSGILPPVSYQNSMILKNHQPSCCEQLYSFLDKNSQYSKDEILENSHCRNDQLTISFQK